MPERSGWRNGVRRAKQIVAAGCGVLAVLLITGTTFALWEALFACADPRHGCVYVILGSLTMLVIAIGFLGTAYVLWPTRSAHEDSSQAV
jgi:hypothetical protein